MSSLKFLVIESRWSGPICMLVRTEVHGVFIKLNWRHKTKSTIHFLSIIYNPFDYYYVDSYSFFTLKFPGKQNVKFLGMAADTFWEKMSKYSVSVIHLTIMFVQYLQLVGIMVTIYLCWLTNSHTKKHKY